MLGSFFSILGGAGYFWGKGLNDIAKRDAGEAYLNAQGYNRDRQRYLDSLVYSTVPEERMKFCRLVGRHVSPTGRDLSDGSHIDENRDRMLALRQIALKEGWKYYDSGDLLADPVYTKLTGMKCNPSINSLAPDWDAIAQKLNEETERKEVWKDRCKHGHEVDVFPMDFGSEYNYQCAVRSEYYAWRKKYSKMTDAYMDLVFLKGIHRVKTTDYETEKDFLEAVKKEEEYLFQFSAYRESEDRFSTSYSIIRLDISWNDYRKRHIVPPQKPTLSDVINFLNKEMTSLEKASVTQKYKEEIKSILTNKFNILGYIPPGTSLDEFLCYGEPQQLPQVGFMSESVTKKNHPEILAHKGESAPHKTQSIKPITAVGKTYTVQRGDKTSKLTLRKRI